jgi:hypothetical protein
MYGFIRNKKGLADAIDEIYEESGLIGLTEDKYLLRKKLDSQLSKIYKEERKLCGFKEQKRRICYCYKEMLLLRAL